MRDAFERLFHRIAVLPGPLLVMVVLVADPISAAASGAEGDETAVAGTRRVILDLFAQAQRHFERSDGERRVLRVPVYFDFYGRIDVHVYAPFYVASQ